MDGDGHSLPLQAGKGQSPLTLNPANPRQKGCGRSSQEAVVQNLPQDATTILPIFLII
jgi:hypothetical protein